MVAHAVLKPGESVPICVMNPTNQPVTLCKATRIAELTKIKEVNGKRWMRWMDSYCNAFS